MIRSVVAVLMVAGLVLVGWSVFHQLDRPVAAVRVLGALSPAEQRAIREVVAGNLDRGVLSLDVAALTASIRDLSWPRAVRVRRIWPDTLEIRVDKETVVAAWGSGGYLTSAGKVVQMTDGARSVPTLSTSLSSPRQAMEIYQMLESRVNRAGLSIAELEENGLGEWLMTFQDGMQLALGNDALGARLQRFLVAYQRALSARRGEIVRVDARYGNGVAVRWREPLLALDSKEEKR